MTEAASLWGCPWVRSGRSREIGLALDTPRPGARGDDDDDDDDEEEDDDDDDDVRYWLTASMTLMHLQWCQSFQLIVVPPSLSLGSGFGLGH